MPDPGPGIWGGTSWWRHRVENGKKMVETQLIARRWEVGGETRVPSLDLRISHSHCDPLAKVSTTFQLCSGLKFVLQHLIAFGE